MRTGALCVMAISLLVGGCFRPPLKDEVGDEGGTIGGDAAVSTDTTGDGDGDGSEGWSEDSFVPEDGGEVDAVLEDGGEVDAALEDGGEVDAALQDAVWDVDGVLPDLGGEDVSEVHDSGEDGRNDADADVGVPIGDVTECADGCGHLDGPCTIGDCVQGRCAAVPAHEGDGCDDAMRCTEDDRCVSGECKGRERVCDDGVSCTIDHCDANTGECTVDDAPCECADDEDCPDVDLCDGRMTCSAQRQCASGPPVVCGGDAPACHEWRCVPASGACVAVAIEQAVSCDDGAWCTVEDACSGGECVGRTRGGAEVTKTSLLLGESLGMLAPSLDRDGRLIRASWMGQGGYELMPAPKDTWWSEAGQSLVLSVVDSVGTPVATRILASARQGQGMDTVSVEAGDDFVAVRFRIGQDTVSFGPSHALAVPDFGGLSCPQVEVLMVLDAELGYAWHALACGRGGLAVRSARWGGGRTRAQGCFAFDSSDEQGVTVVHSKGSNLEADGRGVFGLRFDGTGPVGAIVRAGALGGTTAALESCHVVDGGALVFMAWAPTVEVAGGGVFEFGEYRSLALMLDSAGARFWTFPTLPTRCDSEQGLLACVVGGMGTIRDSTGFAVAELTEIESVLLMDSADLGRATVFGLRGGATTGVTRIALSAPERVVIHLQDTVDAKIETPKTVRDLGSVDVSGGILVQATVDGQILTADRVVRHAGLGPGANPRFLPLALRVGDRGEPIRLAIVPTTNEMMQVGIEDPVPVQADLGGNSALLVMSMVNVEGALECRDSVP